MHQLQTKNPEFTIGLRGYDRAQVDEYIDHLQHLVIEADQRARDAAAEYVYDEHAAVGPRIAEIFALAEAEAREITSAARTAAGVLRERVEREHVVMFAELESERERIRDEVAVLQRRRAEAIGELQRLRERLGDAADMAGSAAETDGRAGAETNGRRGAPTWLIGGSDETVELPAVTDDLDET